MNFSIKEDLKYRTIQQKVEICWISGSTYHNIDKIAKMLSMKPEEIQAHVIDAYTSGRIRGSVPDFK